MDQVEPVPVVPTAAVFGLSTCHTPDGKPWIALHCSSNLGTHTYFLDPKAALALANQMRQAAKDRLSELTIVESRLLDINGESVRLEDESH